MSKKIQSEAGAARPRSYTLRLTPSQRVALCIRALNIAREMAMADGGTKQDREDLRATVAALAVDLDQEPLCLASQFLPGLGRQDGQRQTGILLRLESKG